MLKSLKELARLVAEKKVNILLDLCPFYYTGKGGQAKVLIK